MKKYFLLFKLFLRTSFFDVNNAKAKKARAVGYVLLILFAMGYFGFLLYTAFHAIFGLGLPGGVASAIFAVMILASMMASVFFCMRDMLGVFGNARDLPFLLSLPLRPQTIFAARYTRVYLGELITMAIMLVPLLLAYLPNYGEGLPSIIMGILVFLLSPLIPLGLASLFSMLISRLTQGRKRNDTMTSIISMLLMAGMILGVYALIGRMESMGLDQAALMQMITNASPVMDKIGGFPLGAWAANAVTAPSVAGYQMLFFLLPCVAVTAILVWYGGRHYARYALNESGSRVSSRKGLFVRQHSPLRALVSREMRCIMRSPLYATNSFSGIIMGPVFILLPVLMQSAFSFEEFGGIAGMQSIMVYIAMGIMGFACTLNPGLSTTISREGAAAYMLKIIPVTPGRQMAARILVALISAAIANLLVAIIMPFAWPIGRVEALAAAGVTTLAAISPLIISTIPDLQHPKLDWQTEQQAMKQNFNSMIAMLFVLLALLPHVGLFVLLRNQPLAVGMGASVAFSLLSVLILYKVYPRMAAKYFAKL